MAAEALAAAAELARPERRAGAAADLSALLGVAELLVFVPDPETGRLLPAPGFPQTLPGTRAWRALLAECLAHGRASGEVASPSGGDVVRATAVRGQDGSALVLLGGEPEPSMLEQLRLVLPLLATGLGHERALAVAQAQAQLARSAAAEARQLAESLDLARRELQRLYRQVQQALEFRDEFLGAVAHDLRTPLTAITGYAQLLRRQADRGGSMSDERQRRAMGHVESTALRMRRLVDQIVDVARLRMGQALDLDRRSTDLVALVRRVAAEHQSTANRHVVRVDAAEPELVGQWDPVRLERALDNLVGNAIKYSLAGGEVTISLRRRPDPDRAVVSVTDQGVGIPAAELDQVFERFRRASNSEGFVGSGIGLASVRQIVADHGGEVKVESVEGQGSTFTIALPIDAGQPEPPC